MNTERNRQFVSPNFTEAHAIASLPRKRFEHLNVLGDRRSIVNQRIAKLSRFVVVLFTLLAWVSISNHCALGGLIVTKTQSARAVMHCHGNQPSPSKKSSEEEMPCCKVLRATITGEAKIVEVASKDFLPIQSWIVAELVFAAETQLPPLELDTGPPFADSFAESVLQRSLLAHAPPAFA
jgi:hypothetical protein